MKLFSPMEPSSACSYVATQRGGVALLFEGHRYNKVRDGKDGTVYWRCSRDRQCPGRAVTVNNRVKKSNNKHNHPPEASLLMRNGQAHQTPAALLASQARSQSNTTGNNNSNSTHHSNQSAMAAAAAAAAAYASLLQKPGQTSGFGNGHHNHHNNNNHSTHRQSAFGTNASPSSVTSSSSPSPLNGSTNPFSAFSLLQNLAAAQNAQQQQQQQQNLLGAAAAFGFNGANLPPELASRMGFSPHSLNGLFQQQQQQQPPQSLNFSTRNSVFNNRTSPFDPPPVPGSKPDPSSPPPTPTSIAHRYHGLFPSKDASFHNNNTLELSPRSLGDTNGFGFTNGNGRNHSPSIDHSTNGQVLNLKTELPNSPSSSSTAAELPEFSSDSPPNAAAAAFIQDVFQEAQAAAMAAAFPSLLSETFKYLAASSGPQMAAALAQALGNGAATGVGNATVGGKSLDLASIAAAAVAAAASQQNVHGSEPKKNGKRPHSEADEDDEDDADDVDDLRSSPTVNNAKHFRTSELPLKHLFEAQTFDDEEEDLEDDEGVEHDEEPLNMASNNAQQILRLLRNVMSKNGSAKTESLAALIVPTDDAHGSEYIAPCDARRQFVSNFTGSAGTAVVTQKDARLWTDGRYFLQAGTELDSSCWKLMKDRQPETPTIGEWLNKNIESGSAVGADPFTLSYVTWTKLESELSSCGNLLVPTIGNLVDQVWSTQPPRPQTQVAPLGRRFTGLTWQEKIVQIRAKMQIKQADALVLTALDDCAWLLNLRGSDIQYNPVFFAYVIVTKQQVILFIDNVKLGEDARAHLNLNSSMDTDDAQQRSAVQLEVRPYDSVVDFVKSWLSTNTGKIWISEKSSYALVSQIPKARRVLSGISPVTAKKAIKNTNEVDGMRRAHIKDAVALCELFAWLEDEVVNHHQQRRMSHGSESSATSSATSATQVDELMVDTKLEEFRREQDDYVGRSFASIAGSGPNGAVIHYHCTEATNRPVTTSEMFLLDCGAQFKDGTTDVTRTIHLGAPTAHERECFTRVVKGHISLATANFPRLVKGESLDAFARRALWDVGLDYNHGTGHGVGSYLCVHEGPSGIANRHIADDPGVVENMIFSNEPGYYEAGKFGIRIESLVVTKRRELKFNFNDRGYLGFETITLVPIQTKLLDPTLLTTQEIEWLDQYHQQCRDIVGRELERQGKQRALQWLLKETQPIA